MMNDEIAYFGDLRRFYTMSNGCSQYITLHLQEFSGLMAGSHCIGVAY